MRVSARRWRRSGRRPWRFGGRVLRRSCAPLRRSRSRLPRRGRSGGGWRMPQAARSRPASCWRSGRRGFAPSGSRGPRRVMHWRLPDELASGARLAPAYRAAAGRGGYCRALGAQGRRALDGGSLAAVRGGPPRHLARRRSRALQLPYGRPSASTPARPPPRPRGSRKSGPPTAAPPRSCTGTSTGPRPRERQRQCVRFGGRTLFPDFLKNFLAGA